jgi:hypothetical protein
METKHTKGEWFFRRGFDNVISIYGKKTNKKVFEICRLIGYGGVGMDKIEEANTKLIAAAPELLEALKELYESLPDGYKHKCLPKVKKAIRKATE